MCANNRVRRYVYSPVGHPVGFSKSDKHDERSFGLDIGSLSDDGHRTYSASISGASRGQEANPSMATRYEEDWGVPARPVVTPCHGTGDTPGLLLPERWKAWRLHSI